MNVHICICAVDLCLNLIYQKRFACDKRYSEMSADNTADAQGVPTDVEVPADSTADAQDVPTDVEISADNTADAQGVPTDVKASTDEAADTQSVTTDAKIGKVNDLLLNKNQHSPNDTEREDGVGMEHAADEQGTKEKNENVDEDSEGTFALTRQYRSFKTFACDMLG